MKILDPHIHMSSRSTDDYIAMREAGVVAVIEPAFWLGQPRTNVGTFKDYFSSLVGFERFRAAQFGIRHYCAIGLNSKEANNEALAEEVMDLIPSYAGKEGVVAIGEAVSHSEDAAKHPVRAPQEFRTGALDHSRLTENYQGVWQVPVQLSLHLTIRRCVAQPSLVASFRVERGRRSDKHRQESPEPRPHRKQSSSQHIFTLYA